MKMPSILNDIVLPAKPERCPVAFESTVWRQAASGTSWQLAAHPCAAAFRLSRTGTRSFVSHVAEPRARETMPLESLLDDATSRIRAILWSFVVFLLYLLCFSMCFRVELRRRA